MVLAEERLGDWEIGRLEVLTLQSLNLLIS
jgi:hypothetical protein